MLEEVRSGQIVLAFPITWYFNETDALESRSGTQPLGRFASTERFRRGVRWERIAAIGLVTAAGAFAGAVTGATLGPVGAVAGKQKTSSNTLSRSGVTGGLKYRMEGPLLRITQLC